jgi:GNAT superfamily N-acetyltransferase
VPNQLLELLTDAAEGRFPPADLAVEVLPSPPGPTDAVVAFSGHSIVAASVDPAEVLHQLDPDDPGAPMSAGFLTWLGGRLGSEPGMLDVVLVADGRSAMASVLALEPVDDPALSHGRVERARRYRSSVEVHTDPLRHGLVIMGRGLANRLEVSIEVEPQHRGHGIGAELARAAVALAPDGEALFAQVSPGNVASLRAFLRAGYRPIGSEVLFRR